MMSSFRSEHEAQVSCEQEEEMKVVYRGEGTVKVLEELWQPGEVKDLEEEAARVLTTSNPNFAAFEGE